MKAEIITIGDEILLGQVVDTNSAWIGQQLDSLNIAINQITSISDKQVAIYNSLKLASSRADLIIVTGGLGPTKDDVTKETIAKYFGSTLVRDEKVLAHVRQFFSRRGTGEMPASNYAQADVLSCAEVLFNDVGTAPGMWVDFEGKIFVFLPGVPFEMKFLMENRVIPKLKQKEDAVHIYHAHVIAVGIGESYLAEQIADIEEELPSYIKLAYLPKLGLVRMRLTAIGEDENLLKEETDKFANAIAIRMKDYVIAQRDISLEQAIVETFTREGLKLATAESCSGGNLAGRITSISGSSAIFDCGIVSYSNEIKHQVLDVSTETLETVGAVSEETVIQMANGVKRICAADYGIATSGIAGPTGGTEEKPVGTVWIAVSGKTKVITKQFQFRNDRAINIERTVMQALILLWNLYKEELDS